MPNSDLSTDFERTYLSDPARLRALLETELMDSESQEGFDLTRASRAGF